VPRWPYTIQGHSAEWAAFNLHLIVSRTAFDTPVAVGSEKAAPALYSFPVREIARSLLNRRFRSHATVMDSYSYACRKLSHFGYDLNGGFIHKRNGRLFHITRGNGARTIPLPGYSGQSGRNGCNSAVNRYTGGIVSENGMSPDVTFSTQVPELPMWPPRTIHGAPKIRHPGISQNKNMFRSPKTDKKSQRFLYKMAVFP